MYIKIYEIDFIFQFNFRIFSYIKLLLTIKVIHLYNKKLNVYSFKRFQLKWGEVITRYKNLESFLFWHKKRLKIETFLEKFSLSSAIFTIYAIQFYKSKTQKFHTRL
jgi:hypothetical protein